MKALGERLCAKYALLPYRDPNEPAIFYGIFPGACERILRHRSLAVLLWAGTDLQLLREAYRTLDRPSLNKLIQLAELPFESWLSFTDVFRASTTNKMISAANLPNVRHISRSECLSNDFNIIGLRYKFARVSPVIPEYFPQVPLGNCVYCYGALRNSEKYGGDWIEQLKKDLPHIQFIDRCLEHETTISYGKMHTTYEKCFIGLRLTKHDGLPNTVLEMGLMGRKCVYNGDLPNAVPYNTYDDVKNIIEREYKNRGEPSHVGLAEKTRKLLDISDDWLQTVWHDWGC